MPSDFGIYIHTPWCKSRCPYCAFNVYLSHTADYVRWQSSILAAWSRLEGRFQGTAHSLYFGGGTPSLAPPKAVAELIDVDAASAVRVEHFEKLHEGFALDAAHKLLPNLEVRLGDLVQTDLAAAVRVKLPEQLLGDRQDSL